jgi:Flp pilus assembly protein TadD
VPFIGLFVAIAWGVPALVAGWRPRRLVLGAAAAAVVLALAAATSARVAVWRDSETLFLDAIAKTKGNYLAHINLGNHYIEMNRVSEALSHFQEAERIRPDEPEVHVGLGYAHILQARVEDAARSFERVLELQPRHGVALNNLARIRFLEGEIPEALRLYRATVAARPDWAEGRRRLAVALLMEGDVASAANEVERAAALDPSDAEAQSLRKGLRALEQKDDPEAEATLLRFLADAEREAIQALRRRGRTAEAAARESRAHARSIPSR